ncbi:MAG TPA: lipopolysaccharide heptosyltransferase I [Thermoanaerobaculia bacterium]|nr:lipopolysaccharide heptosyltransferase I [Thermoanaerobaculia bacterium]
MLVLRLSAMGDVIHTIPAVVALREVYPAARFGWLVESPFLAIVEAVAKVDEIFVARTRAWRRDPWAAATRSEIVALGASLRRFARGGMSVDFQGLVKSAAPGLVAGAGRRFGFAPAQLREKVSSLFTNRHVDVNGATHVVDMNMALARGAGARAQRPPEVDFTSLAVDGKGTLQPLVSNGPVVMLPGAGQLRKQWAPENFAALADAVQRRHGMSSVIAWGPGEEALASEICRRSTAAQLAPATDLRELAFLLKGGKMVVAGDTGPLHLAAALGTRVVGLFGPTDPRRNGPYGQLQHCVETFSTTGRMEDIRVEEAMKKIEEVLSCPT